MLRLSLAAGVLVSTALVMAFAATLPLSTERLTTSDMASSVPISTCTLAANADSYVDEFSFLSNFGTSTTLDVQSAALSNRRTLLRFDVASCSMASNASVRTATLTLYLYDAPTGDRTYQVHRVTAAWTETGVTWNNQPAVAGSATTTFTTGTTDNVSKAFSVLADVQAFVAGTQTNNGWRLRDQTESNSGLGRFRSDEFGTVSQRPKLEITYYP